MSIHRLTLSPSYLEILDASVFSADLITRVNPKKGEVLDWLKKHYVGYDALKKGLLAEAVADIENVHLRAIVQQHLGIEPPPLPSNVMVKVEPFRRGGYIATVENDIKDHAHRGAVLSFIHHTQDGALYEVREMARKLWLT